MSSRIVAANASSAALEVERYSLRERICHWLNGFSYLYCLLTGLALFSPLLYWLASILGGGPVIRFWHPWVGIVFVSVLLWMHGLWRGDMKTTEADRKWRGRIKDYIENRDQSLPPQGRFNAGQKQFYWVMFYGAAGLLLSGLVLWFPEGIARQWHWLLPVAIMVHEISALATVAAFMIHIYMGLFIEPKSFRAIISGRVPAAWARMYHRLWFDEVSRSSQLQK